MILDATMNLPEEADLLEQAVLQMDRTMASPGFLEKVNFHPSVTDKVITGGAREVLKYSPIVAHFPGVGDFVLSRNGLFEGEYVAHTIFNDVPLTKVVECAKQTIVDMATLYELDALATLVPTDNRGARALCRAIGMSPLGDPMENGQVWTARLPDLMERNREWMMKAKELARPEECHMGAVATALLIRDSWLDHPWLKPKGMKRVLYHLAQFGPVALETHVEGQFLIFGEGAIIPMDRPR